MTESILKLKGATGKNKGKKASGKIQKGSAKGKKGANSKGKTPTSASSKSKTPAAKGTGSARWRGSSAKSLPPLQRAPADKRPMKTPLTAHSASSSGASSASSKMGQSPGGGSYIKTPADARHDKKRENHVKSLNKTGFKGIRYGYCEGYCMRRVRFMIFDLSINRTMPPTSIRTPPPPPSRPVHLAVSRFVHGRASAEQSSRGTLRQRSKIKVQLQVRPRRVSRSKLHMQKPTISSHIEDGIVFSQWCYTEFVRLGTQPSSVADLLQGAPRQQLNLPQQQ
ncbi:hypothetical protein PENTCL1PPCAC_13832, partial [Pristionchus entomophagus]